MSGLLGYASTWWNSGKRRKLIENKTSTSSSVIPAGVSLNHCLSSSFTKYEAESIDESDHARQSEAYYTPVKQKLSFFSTDDEAISADVALLESKIQVENNVDEKTLSIKHPSKEECKDYYFKMYGKDLNKTLKPLSHGAGYHSFMCAASGGCDFKLVISRHVDMSWSLSPQGSRLTHERTNEHGVVSDCNGIFQATTKELGRIPAVQALIGNRTDHKTIMSVAKTQGAKATKDVIKKSYAKKKLTRSALLYIYYTIPVYYTVYYVYHTILYIPVCPTIHILLRTTRAYTLYQYALLYILYILTTPVHYTCIIYYTYTAYTRSALELTANYVEPYLDELRKLNPGCTVRLDKLASESEGDKFQRLFVIPSYTKPLINDEYGFSVVGLDAAHMKDVVLKKRIPRALLEKCVVTVISGRLPGNTQVIYALMLSQSECSEDIKALLDLLAEEGINLDKETMIIVSDRGKAIIKAVLDNITKAYHHFCPLHIEGNLKAAGFGGALALFWLARNATTKAEHDKYMNIIKQHKTASDKTIGERMHTYLSGITDNWQVHLVVSKGLMLYGFKSSNIVETTMGWLKEARKEPAYYFVRGAMRKIATDITKQAEAAEESNRVLTPYADGKYLEHKRRLMCYAYHIDACGGKLYQVRSGVENRLTTPDYRIDLNTHTCTCLQWSQRGIPCIHAAAVAEHLNLTDDVLYAAPFFHPSMLQSRRKEAFAKCVSAFVLPAHDQVVNVQATGGYQPMSYRIIENYPKLSTTKRFPSSGESSHAGTTNPRSTELRKCIYCHELMKSEKNHSVSKCMAKIAELKAAGAYTGPLDA